MRILPMGTHSVLVEDPPGGPARWSEGLRAVALDGLVDVVPAAATVLVRCRDEAARRAVEVHLPTIEPRDRAAADLEVTIRVRYDGPDLDAVASATGLSIDEVVDVHRTSTYQVAFCGFAPGFGYLTGLPDRLRLPRRETPRTYVPAGSVAIAAEYSAVYPRPSPGGWHLLGHTDQVLFDPGSKPPALLQPGTVVRFEAI